MENRSNRFSKLRRIGFEIETESKDAKDISNPCIFKKGDKYFKSLNSTIELSPDDIKGKVIISFKSSFME